MCRRKESGRVYIAVNDSSIIRSATSFFTFYSRLSPTLDVEESVVARVLAALTSLCELGLFQKMRIWELMSANLGFLYHPNAWIRQGTSQSGSPSQVDVISYQVRQLLSLLQRSTFRRAMSGAFSTLHLDIFCVLMCATLTSQAY
jgi:hypothetical protein